MKMIKPAVMVEQISNISSMLHGEVFLRKFWLSTNIDRPSIVLDCSSLKNMDKFNTYVLLCCLENALKHNGDVKLAALPENTSTTSYHAWINRLFDVYDTTAEAVNSFSHCQKSTLYMETMPGPSTMETQRAG